MGEERRLFPGQGAAAAGQGARIEVERSGALRGEVRPLGAKNAALPILIATVLADGPVRLANVPANLIDVGIVLDLLRSIGVQVEVEGSDVTLNAAGPLETELSPSLGKRIRYSLLFLGALGARCGAAWVPYPGGCKIGDREFDLHLMGLERLGAKITQEEEGIRLEARELRGAEIEFRLPTTSGTENIMIAASLAKGRTTLINAQTRPEIRDLARFLNAMGARVEVLNRIVEIDGVDALRPADWQIMFGRDEAFTYIVACGLCGGEIMVPGLSSSIMRAELEEVRKAGMEVFDWGGSLYVASRKGLTPFDIQTAPYPGINSDLQPLFAALALSARGISTITDTRFPDRFAYAEEMRRLGADIHACGNCAIVRGGKSLVGTTVHAHDIRTGAALVLAGLVSDGTTTITGVDQIDRGYDRIEEKLSSLGAKVRRLPGV
jgi:UDP-N-acetylglucosamine 1-carboxyvinyltransferase